MVVNHLRLDLGTGIKVAPGIYRLNLTVQILHSPLNTI